MATIEPRGGKWRALVRIKGHPSASKTFNRRKAAEDWGKSTEDALRAGKALPGSVLSLGELIDKYEKELARFKPVSATKHGNLKRWKESLGDRAVDSLTGQDLLDHIAQRRILSGNQTTDDVARRKISPATMAVELGFLAEVLSAGRELWNMTIPDVVGAVRKTLRRTGAIGKPQERDRRPTDDELKALDTFFQFNLFTRIPMRDLVPFAIDSALRLDEIMKLRWEDYRSGDKPTVLVRGRKHPTKKEGNDQWIPLLGRTVEIIERQARGAKLIFPYKGDSVGAAFRRACLRLHIEDLHFHDLRHEGTSRLFETGYQIQEVALVTGHRDWKSLKRYTQLRPVSLHRG